MGIEQQQLVFFPIGSFDFRELRMGTKPFSLTDMICKHSFTLFALIGNSVCKAVDLQAEGCGFEP